MGEGNLDRLPVLHSAAHLARLPDRSQRIRLARAQYAVGSAEFRYLLGLNAYLFTFLDGGWARNNTYQSLVNHGYLGTGFGVALETKAGMLNLSFAVGKRDDTSFSLRQSKIHFGFASIF